MINRVLLHSTSMKGNLDAVPHACTVSEEGDAPVPYRPSYMFGLLARRATKNAHAVQWPEGTIQQRDLGVPYGAFIRCDSYHVVGGLFFDFGAVRTEPRCSAQVLEGTARS